MHWETTNNLTVATKSGRIRQILLPISHNINAFCKSYAFTHYAKQQNIYTEFFFKRKSLNDFYDFSNRFGYENVQMKYKKKAKL